MFLPPLAFSSVGKTILAHSVFPLRSCCEDLQFFFFFFQMFMSHSCIAIEALLVLHLELKSYFICPKYLLIYSGMISLLTLELAERQVLLQINQTHSSLD